jgi:hypothetical protein
MLADKLKGAGGGGGGLTALDFYDESYSRSTSNTTDAAFTLPSGWQEGDLAVVSAFWDGEVTQDEITAPAGWTEIVNNTDGTEYPEGASFYKVLESGDTGVTLTSTRSDTYAGAMMVFNPTGSITTVTVGNTDYADGPSALSSSIAADSPTTVATGTIRLKGYFLTGRPLGSSIQNPVPTFTQSGWTWVDGEGIPNATDSMDYAYKILSAGTTDVTEAVSTTDAGRQAHHIFSLTLE